MISSLYASKIIDSLQEEPVSEDLEEAANEIVNKAIPPLAVKYKDGTYVGSIRDCFDRKEFIDLVKAGAQWQKEKMIKQSVDGKVIARFPLASDPFYNDVEVYLNFTKGLSEGDKVKVIIIKDE